MDTTVPTFTIVPREVRDSIVPIHRNRFSDHETPLVAALVTGETLFVEQEPKALASLYQMARRRGYTMTLRQGYSTDNSKAKGCYVWWEKTPATAEGK